MPEYGVEVPLWGPWQRLNLDPALVGDLERWQSEFDRNFEPEEGWLDEHVRARWAETARSLTARLKEALPVDVELTVDLWPIDPK